MNNEKALKYIRNAYGLAIFSGIITLGVIILSAFGIWKLGYDLFNLLDVALIFGLAFGIKKKSRVCAVTLFIYYIICKIIMIITNSRLPGLSVTMIIFIIGYFQGIRGTMYYHKHMKIERRNDEILNENLKAVD